ncbi:MAG: hypothetical protein QOE89_1124, partial [Pseudonocardiales bacterium]|nr:hypothetical protein [Pseudonocardiales bacterium]
MTMTDRAIPPDPALHHTDVGTELDTAVDQLAHRVLLTHGGQPSSSLIWTRVRPLLQACGLRELAIESPGCGPTTGVVTDPVGNAAAIAAELDKQRTSPTIVVGHSLGAGIALALAATTPHHVRALVLVAPAAGPTAITATDRALAARV